MYPRYSRDKVAVALIDTPAVVVVGPRQSGKTTLIKSFTGEDWTYVTLDDISQLQFAQDDPMGYIRALGARHVIIDEIQRVPELILPLKQAIDENRLPGRYLLSGSANAMALPQVADSLAGRLEVIQLQPLSQCEIMGCQSAFLSKLLAGEMPQSKRIRIRDEMIQRVVIGGYPEALARTNEDRRFAWFQQYMTSIIQKDLRELADIEHLSLMPKFIRILANQTAQLSNQSHLAQALKVPQSTVKRYCELLKKLFIVQDLPAWHSNESKRLVRSPKSHMMDTGLACGIRQINLEKLTTDRTLFGHLLENYVLCELQKIASWRNDSLSFYHYRDKDKLEVDVVIETAAGDVIGVEVKSGATVTSTDFQGLKRLKKLAGNHFKGGVLLYDGDHSNQVEPGIYSAPLWAIWEG